MTLSLPIGVGLAACQAPKTSASAVDSTPPTSMAQRIAAIQPATSTPAVAATSPAPATPPAATPKSPSKPSSPAATASSSALSLTAASTKPPGLDSTWSLAFDDDFDGSSLDTGKWVTNIWQGNRCGANIGTHGAQDCYSPSAVTQSNGKAHLTATRNSFNFNGSIFPYTSGIINSDQKYSFTYGYVDVRAKLPKGKGLWPAIWLYNPAYTVDEIDLMEFIGEDQATVYQTLHDRNGGENQFKGKNTDWSADYHNYAVNWQPGSLTFYIDGVETGRLTNLVPSEKMYLMVNLDVGGPSSWGGAADNTTAFPSTVDVDYVHVYQQH